MDKLAKDYLKRANIRLEILRILYEKKDYPDVVREAQEVVELALKAVLRNLGVEVPRMHDVSRILEKYKNMLPKEISSNLNKIKRISKRLRKERELSFYGAEDFIPLEEYDKEEALKAIKDAEFVVNTVLRAYQK
ncbi:MAG: HEPN domain-containing protein [Candidatus Asgardarchaeia archaeon]